MKPIRLTLLAAALGLVTGVQAHAIPFDPTERAKAFATCLGRYAATEEFAAIIGEDAETAAERRAMFAELLEAVTPSAGIRPSQLSRYRLGAKNAQKRLVRMAVRAPDAARARTAGTMARRQIRMCDQLILG
jgi:hypothetical protein